MLLCVGAKRGSMTITKLFVYTLRGGLVNLRMLMGYF